MKRSVTTSILLFFFAILSSSQDKDSSLMQQAIVMKNFTFKAESANPQRSRMRQLTSEYDVVVHSDSVISFLPYFGRAFVAPLNSSDGGIKFTSTDFDYAFSKKKRNWEIRISPKDVSDVREMYLTIFKNGRASLSVSSVNRETISFSGYIQEGELAAKKAF